MAQPRKFVRIEEVERVFGAEVAQRLLDELTPKPPPPPPAPFDTQELVAASQIIGITPHDLRQWKARIPGVLAAFAGNDKRTKTRFFAYVNHQLELADTNEGVAMGQVAPVPEPRKRKPITDPEVLAKRNQALERARAARQERLRARRGEGAGEAQQYAMAR